MTLRNSAKEVFRDSPEDYCDYYLTETRQREETEPIMLGRMVHQILLEPDQPPWWTTIPRDVLNAQGHKKGKAWLEFEAEHEEQFLLKQDQFDRVMRIVEAVRSHPKVRPLLDHPQAKREFQLTHTDEHGLERTGRCDILLPGMLIWDLKVKTGEPPTPEVYWKSVRDRGYHRGAAWYNELWKQMSGEDLPFVFCFAQLDEPHRVACYELDQLAMERGAEQNAKIMRHFHECRESGIWRSAWANEIYMSPAPAYLLYPENWELAIDDHLQR